MADGIWKDWCLTKLLNKRGEMGRKKEERRKRKIDDEKTRDEWGRKKTGWKRKGRAEEG